MRFYSSGAAIKEKSKEAILKYREYYIPYGIYENQLYSGMDQLLSNIVKQGSNIILATSKPTIFAEKILKYFKIDQYFEFIAGSEMDLSRYGKGEVIEYALRKMNINSENAIMIGNRKHDIIGAKENKLASIGVLYGYGKIEEMENAHADYIAHDIYEHERLMINLCN